MCRNVSTAPRLPPLTPPRRRSSTVPSLRGCWHRHPLLCTSPPPAVAAQVPSALSLHYSGAAEGPATLFALEMRHFEVESERCQMPSPHLAAARTLLLDYFRGAAKAADPSRWCFRYERGMDLGEGERTLLDQLCAQLAFPREDAQLKAYFSGEDPSLVELFPELAMFRAPRRTPCRNRRPATSAPFCPLLEPAPCPPFRRCPAPPQPPTATNSLPTQPRTAADSPPPLTPLRRWPPRPLAARTGDIVYMAKVMMAPASDHLPEIRAWTPADARLVWRYKHDDKKPGYVVRGFGADMKSAGWIDSNDELLATKRKAGLIDRLLGRGGPKPRLPSSAADASVLAGTPLAAEDDVLHLRHLPDFGGCLRASDVEYLLQVLLAPYLRIPLLLKFFSDPIRTPALASPELQQMIDAALFEPGEWQPDRTKQLPKLIPAPDRAHLTTPVGMLFNELTHAPAPSIGAVTAILDNALDLDAGRYVRGGSSSTILFAIRLATRLAAYLEYLLSPRAQAVRGLALPGTPDFGGDTPAKAQLRASSATLRHKLHDAALPVLQGWYARLRRDSLTRDACTVAAHMAAIHADGQGGGGGGASASGAASAADESERGLDARSAFVLLSTRVYINVHYDFELEPEAMLGSRHRKRTVAAAAHTSTAVGELGYAPLEVFDMWQRSLHRTLGWLSAEPEQTSDVMEATVRLLSGKERSAKLLTTRNWQSMRGHGCDGRYTPDASGTTSGAPAGAAERAGWGSEAEAEAAAAAKSGGYPAWLRVKVSAAAETEINVQLGEMTLKRHHMQLLDGAVAHHADFLAVFGENSDGGRHQCAEVKRSSRRRWLRLLGTRHDVQIWAADERSPPVPRAAMLQGALSPWVMETLEPIKASLPLLSDPAVTISLTDLQGAYALLSAVVGGSLKELVLYREPPVLHVYNVVEHGRRFVRDLIYISDAARCYGVPSGRGSNGGTPSTAAPAYAIGTHPRLHWEAGDVGAPATAAPSLVISRALSASAPLEYFVPNRQLNGLLPLALIDGYRFWRTADGQSLLGVRVSKTGAGADAVALPAPAAAGASAAGGDKPTGGDGGGGATALTRASTSEGLAIAGSDELSISIGKGGAVVRRIPRDASGSPLPSESRRLIAALTCDRGTPLHALVSLIERFEDLAHVLMWSAKESESGAAASSNPFGGGGISNPFAAGGDTDVPLALLELPRLHLSFEAVKQPADGSVRIYSKEHPGHYLSHADGERMTALLRGLPHALLLLNEDGDHFVLLSALAKPCRLSDPSEPLSSQLLLSRASPEWAEALPGVRHHLYAVHRSQSFLVPPSLAACLNLLILRWLARDFEAAFALCPACATDTPLTADERQLWDLLGSFDDDIEPEAHACRLRLSLATRSCPEMAPAWDVAEQLSLYLTKLSFVPASCQLSAPDELLLLRAYGAASAEAQARVAFLDAALDAALAQEMAQQAAAHNPFASSAAVPPAPQLSPQYPPRPPVHDFDVALEPSALLLQPEALATWQKKLTSLSYSRPDEVSGLNALKLLNDWVSAVRIDADSKGFWLLYELLSGSLNLKILLDDSPHALGSLLLRLAHPSHGEELRPILRLMESNRAFANEMPKFEDTRSKGLKLFKGKAGKGMPEKIHSSLQSLLPRLPDSGRLPSHTPYSPPLALPMPPLRDLRTIHRTWLAPAALGVAATERLVPPRFAPSGPAEQATVLAPIDPLNYLRRANPPANAGGGAAGAAGSRPPQVQVERHPASGSVVAQRMLKRIVEDVTWLVSDAAQSATQTPKLAAFEGATSAPTALPSHTELQARGATVSRLLAALESLYTEDTAAYDALLPEVQSLITAGGASAPDAKRRARALAQLAGCEMTASVELCCGLLMSSHGEAELRVLNPLLSDSEVAQALSDFTALLMLTSRAQLVSRALVVARRLQAILTTVAMHASSSGGGAPAPVALHAAAEAHALADQLAGLLSTRRAHVRSMGSMGVAPPAGAALTMAAGGGGAQLDPRILVFEFTMGVVLRPQQVALLSKLVMTARNGGSVCHQMLMGEGKTTVVSPLLALQLADGLQLVLQVVPAPLLRFTLQVLRSIFRSGPLRKSVCTFAFDRRTEVSEGLLLAANIALQERAVMVSTPASVKAFMLKLLELLHLLDTGMYPRMHSALGRTFRKLLRVRMQPAGVQEGGLNKPALLGQAARAVQLLQLWRGAVAVIDEVDIVLHPLRSELNWPLGDRHPLDFAPTRWELPWYLLDALLTISPPPGRAAEQKQAASAGGFDAVASSFTGKDRAVLQRLHEAVESGLSRNLMQRIPHLILLSDAFYHQTLRPLLAEWLLLWLRRQGLRDVTDDQATRCLLGGTKDAAVQQVLSDRHVKMLNLGADWLSFLLPHALRKVSRVHYGLLKPEEMKEMSAKGGLPRSRRYLAVPFVGKDAPSHAAEFAHPDVAIGLTILAYRYEGMRHADFGPALRLLRQGLDEETGPILKRPSSLTWIAWMHAAGRRVRGIKALQAADADSQASAAGDAGTALLPSAAAVSGVPEGASAMPSMHRRRAEAGAAAAPPRPSALSVLGNSEERAAALDAVVGGGGEAGSSDILPLHLLDVMDAEYMAVLYDLLCAKSQVIRYYLESLVFPDTTAHQPMKLSANGQDVGGEMLFQRRIAFSGTPSSLLPLEMGDCVYQMGDDAKMLRTLTDPAIVSSHALPAGWNVIALLDAVASLQPHAHALIDTGALVTGMSNREVAAYLLPRLPESVEGAVYLERGGHKKILLRGSTTAMDLERCGLPKERRFSFFDQVHTTGMDIPQGASARAVLTLGKDLTFRDYAQGAYRMRGIGKGQTIVLFVIPEVHRLCASEVALGAGCTTDALAARRASMPQLERQRAELEGVASWLVINSMKSERVQFELWCMHCAQNVWRKRALRQLLMSHASFADARDGKGASESERRALEVFRERLERDVSNSVPTSTDTRQAIAMAAQLHGELLQEVEDVRAIESVQAMLIGYTPEQTQQVAVDDARGAPSSQASAFEQEQEQEQGMPAIAHMHVWPALRARTACMRLVVDRPATVLCPLENSYRCSTHAPQHHCPSPYHILLHAS